MSVGSDLPALRSRRTRVRPSAPGRSHIDHGQREFLAGDGRLRGLGAADPVHRVVCGRQSPQDGVGNDVIVFYK